MIEAREARERGREGGSGFMSEHVWATACVGHTSSHRQRLRRRACQVPL